MKEPKRIWIMAAFAALYFGWGSTFLGILFAIQSIHSPFALALSLGTERKGEKSGILAVMRWRWALNVRFDGLDN
jgi:hypothetical protein